MRFIAAMLALCLSSVVFAGPKQPIELDLSKVLTIASIGQEEPPPALQPAPPKTFLQTPAGKITLVSASLVVLAASVYGVLLVRAQVNQCSDSPTDLTCRNNGISGTAQ
jgi:hypothetical protein